MFKKDTLWLGVIAGLVTPVLAFLFLIGLLNGLDELIPQELPFTEQFRTRTLFLIGICANLILLQTFQIRNWPKAMRGLVMGTGVHALIWLFVFGIHLL